MKKTEILNLVTCLGGMKTLKRKGWRNRCVPNSESDADHSYSLAMLVLLFAPKHLDLLKCLKLALVHDLPEVLCGDWVPGELSATDKNEREADAIQKLAMQLEAPCLQELFIEFEQHQTPEARFVWTMDRVDNVFTARYYDKLYDKNLSSEFAGSAAERVEQLPDMKTQRQLKKVLRILTQK